ncbi:MAG TPA: response regulator [Candidatus Udaeobacter sp.]|nr:response regulator [Candidatus Udaeobacter sp.]
MIRIVLADDEPLIIKGLRKLIDWEAFGTEIVGQAYDGNELMELIEEHRPEIVFSDISMPHRTGIDIIKELRSKDIPTKIIFISAYQEFSYARDAVAYGAVDYLVKPVVKQQLENVLAKAISLITEQHEQSVRKSKLQHLERKSKSDELQEWLLGLIDGTLPANPDACKQLEEELHGPLLSAVIVETDHLTGSSDRWKEKERRLIEFAIGNILQELVVDSGNGQVMRKNGKYILVMNHEEVHTAVNIAQDIRDKIKAFLKLSVSIGIGQPVKLISELEHSCGQAEQALQLKYFNGLNRIHLFKPLESKPPFDKELYALQMAVVSGLTVNQWPEAETAINKLLETIRTAAYGNRTLAVTTCFSSILFIIQELTKSGMTLAAESVDLHDLQNRLGAYETFEAMKDETVRAIGQIFSMQEVDSGNKDKMLMAKVKQYIDEHYAEEITLESVAGLAFINPYYFSSFFKKHTKQNFKQYVTEVRMKHAVRLLIHTDQMVYEIAEKVGYNNARHFSDMFKKQYGQLPNDYRQERKKQE